jgi:hypothetical protein
MRKLIETVFNYSLDGLLADEGTDLGVLLSACLRTRRPMKSGVVELRYRRHRSRCNPVRTEALPEGVRAKAVPPCRT